MHVYVPVCFSGSFDSGNTEVRIIQFSRHEAYHCGNSSSVIHFKRKLHAFYTSLTAKKKKESLAKEPCERLGQLIYMMSLFGVFDFFLMVQLDD